MALIERVVVGPLQTNAYFICAEASDSFALIDPAGEADVILAKAAAFAKSIEALLVTHAHVDHIQAAAQLRRETGAKLYVHADDVALVEEPHPYLASMVGGVEKCPVDVVLSDGDELDIAGLSLRVMHTPGHSPGGVCYITDDICFSGDTLFADSVGRTDFPGCDQRKLLLSLARMLRELPDETRVYPGHGLSTTIGHERASNPFLQNLPPM